MKTVLHAATLAALLVLVACSTTDPRPAPETALASEPRTARGDSDNVITGSRLPGKRTDRVVRSIGSQDYKDARDSVPNPLNSQ